MNDTGAYVLDDAESAISPDDVTALPEVRLNARIEGPCFVLQVEGKKVEGELLIQHMRVIGSSIDGVPRVAYTFQGPIDALGVAQLSPLLTQITTTGDVQFLKGIFQTTESFATADWKAEPLQPVTPAGIRSVVPTFEAFCGDPGLLSRDFWCVRNLEDDSSERLEAQISGAGEFVEVRLFVEGSKGQDIWLLRDYFKALLPSEPGRSVTTSYGLASKLLEATAREWASVGRGGIEAVFSEWRCDVLKRGHEEGQLRTRASGGVVVISDSGGCEIPSIGLRLRYQITPEWAQVSVESQVGIGSSRAEIRVTHEKRAKGLSASQVRCVIGLLSCIAQQRWVPENEFEAYMLERLQGHRTPNGSYAPGSMQALELSIAYTMTDPATFFSKEATLLLASDKRCEEEPQALASPKLLLDVLRGAQVLALTLAESVARRRPELFSGLVLAQWPDGSVHVACTSRLGGEMSAILLLSKDSTVQSKTVICDLLYEAFANQEQRDWFTVCETIRRFAVVPGGSPTVKAHPTSLLDSGLRASVTTAGRLAYLLSRGRDTGMQCALSTTEGGKVKLCAFSFELCAAVEVVFDRAQLLSLRFLHQPEREGHGPVRWSELGVLQRPLGCLGGGPLDEVVSCARSFFRDPHGTEAAMHASPAGRVFQQIVERLAPEGFVLTASAAKA
jgi:hypothetical protein